jgi:hypothetical protein
MASKDPNSFVLELDYGGWLPFSSGIPAGIDKTFAQVSAAKHSLKRWRENPIVTHRMLMSPRNFALKQSRILYTVCLGHICNPMECPNLTLSVRRLESYLQNTEAISKRS